MIQDTLRSFHRSQSGSPVFSLPSGERVDLREKRSRHKLASWIVDQFNGDLEAADEAVSSVMARALREARAPWPYLLAALRGIAEEADTREPLSRDCTSSVVASRIGKCHFTIARTVLGGCTDCFTIGGRQYDLVDDDDYSLAFQDLLGDDPFPLFVATAPQFSKYLNTRYLVDDLTHYRAITNDVTDRNEAQAMFLGFLGNAISCCTLASEFRDCLKRIKQFYSRFFHPAVLVTRMPGTSQMRSILDPAFRERCLSLFRRENNLDLYRSDWLRQAISLGIVTNPMSWLLFIMLRCVDTAEAWMDMRWYDTLYMCEEYGLKRVADLFPELVTR